MLVHTLDRSTVEDGLKAVASSFEVMKTVLAKLLEERDIGEKLDVVEAAQKNVDMQIKSLREKIRRREPAVPVSESIKPDHLVSLIDGSQIRYLKRHLKAHNLTMEEYRMMFDLPSDYPSVPPSMSKMLSVRLQKTQPWKK